MSRRKTERLLGLVVCLLSSPRYLTAVQIRAAVPGYPESFEAFKRMFERDKEELRELGIPLETGFNSPGDDEAGYRIPRQAYVLPEIRLEPDEAAVLSLAARVWRQAELAGAAAGALLKLRAAGVDATGEETAQPGIEPRLLAGEAAFGPLWEAVRDRRPVTFAYRAVGRSEPQQRHLQPWGVVNRHGRWYVAGYDTDRDAARVFRLSRIEGEVRFTGPAGSVIVPQGTDVRETVREWDTQPPAQQRAAVLRVRQGAGYGIRRYATPVPGGMGGPGSTGLPDGTGSGPGSDTGSTAGWDTISVPFSDVGWFAEHLASFGTDVVALEPADLREAVITQLKGALA
jgi:proteasome accessory factor B